VQLARRLLRPDRQRAAQEDRPGVEPGLHLHDADPGFASPAMIARWIGAAPRQRGSRLAWMFRQP
jgi:hypothetical protein